MNRLLTLLLLPLCLNAQDATVRTWTNQQGRSIKASLVEVSGVNVVLLLENGSRSTVPVAGLSKSDQIYIQAMHGGPAPAVGGTKAAKAALPLPAAPTGPLVWPAAIAVNPKAVNITQGLQNEAERKYHYQSGSFGFIANAPLTGTVMKEVAADFELVRTTFAAFPWGWHPKPEEGTLFKVYLTETEDDFVAIGGTDGSAAGSKDDYVFVKFSALGLKKVGAKYAYDARQKAEGQVVGMTARLMIGDMRNLLQPWAALGMEKFLRTVAYHNGALTFTNLESALKAEIKNDLAAGAKLDLKSLVETMQSPGSAQRSNVKQIRVQNYFNGMLLVYYFGFLDGSNAGLHQYFREVAQEAMAWRAYRETNGKSGRPEDRSKSSEDIALAFQEKLLAGRDITKLAAEMAAKFKAIGIKFDN